jgi:hypothetical protein
MLVVSYYTCCRSRKPRLRPYGILPADYTAPLYPQKLTLTSPTSDGRSVGRVRSRTQATVLLLLLLLLLLHNTYCSHIAA